MEPSEAMLPSAAGIRLATTATVSPAFAVERGDPAPDRAELRLSGALDVDAAAQALERLRALLARPSPHVRLDLARLSSLDGAGASLLLRLCEELRARGSEAELTGAAGRVRDILELYATSPAGVPPRGLGRPPGVLEQVGRSSADLVKLGGQVLDFTGRTLVAALKAVREPGSVPWRDVLRVMERTGADALPIVGLISFLVGLVSAFQGAITLHEYGADIFVADGVAIGVTRELGPLMVAIVGAGRSGAAFAAELGTMRVSEEVDALRTVGLDPYRYLVLPRLLALSLMLPILTLLGDFFAIAGGFVVGVGSLDLTFGTWARQTHNALTLWHVGSGLLKSVAFGAAIALVACQWGLSTRGGAEGVGRSTTSAVVSSLFFLVVIDAAFTVLFHAWDL
jgi:phospholipid/cholesterol/gamma-HCH transport system permease protein